MALKNAFYHLTQCRVQVAFTSNVIQYCAMHTEGNSEEKKRKRNSRLTLPSFTSHILDPVNFNFFNISVIISNASSSVRAGAKSLS